MDEDLYQVPSGAPALPQIDPMSTFSNLSDNVIDHYQRMNSSNLAITSGSSLYPDLYQLTPTQTADQSLRQFSSNTTYSSYEQSLQFPPLSNYTPDPSLIRTMSKTARMRSRIQTLDPHLLTLPNKRKDEESFHFSSDILPSNFLTSQNYFNPSDSLDSSFFVPKNDDMSVINLAPVPGYEGDYLQLDGLEEDAEYLSEDSDDGDYFQDDDDYIDEDYNFPDLVNAVNSINSINPMNLNLVSQLNNVTPIPPSSDYMRGFEMNNHPEVNFPDDLIQETINFDRAMTLDNDKSLEQKTGEIEMGYLEDNLGDEMEAPESNESEVVVAPQSDEIEDIGKNYDEDYCSPLEHSRSTKISTNDGHYDKSSTCQICLKQFSRPYDLVRHENTVHATKKKIFRCVICEDRLHGGPGNGKSKTFSRADALTRHVKMKHGLEGNNATNLVNDAKENVEYV